MLREHLDDVLNTMKKMWFTELFWRKCKTTEGYWFVFKNAKKVIYEIKGGS